MPIEWATGAGAEHRLRRAAGLGAVGLRVGPELQGDAEHLRPPLALEQGGDGAVDAAGHGDEHARRRRGRRAGRPRRRRAPRAAVQRVGGELGGVALGGVSPPSSASTSSMPIRAAARTGPPSTISAAAAVAARIAPQPSASKVAAATRPPSIRSEIRERSPQAAPPAAPVKAPSGTARAASRPAGSARKLPIHTPRVEVNGHLGRRFAPIAGQTTVRPMSSCRRSPQLPAVRRAAGAR